MARRQKQPRKAAVTDLADEGYGLTEDQRFAVYGLLPGETATILPRKKKKGVWLSLHENRQGEHPDRVTPACAHADVCGGCAFQHLAHERQIEFKEARLKRLFEPLQPLTWMPPLVGSASGYRSKARLGVKFVTKRDEVLVGFREKASPFVAEMRGCTVLDERLADLIPPLREMIQTLSVRQSIPQIEVAAAKQGLALVFRHLEPLTESDIETLLRFEATFGVQILLQSGGPETIIALSSEQVLALSYDLPEEALSFDFQPLDFTQVNYAMNERMTRQAVELLDLNKQDRVIDAFCGIGNFSLPIAKRAGQVLGLESSVASVERAKSNAIKNKISNATFEVSDLYSDEVAIHSEGFNKLLIDPPRSGAEQLVRGTLIDSMERIVYVSCYPESLARDSSTLCGRGFRVEAVGLVDMFPHTTHLESMALFVREPSHG